MFPYRNRILHAAGVPIPDIADEIGTPFYLYDADIMTATYRRLSDALATALPAKPVMICYAIKANSNLAVIKHFAGLGAGIDVVSGGELARGLQAGVPAEKIVFAGVGKTRDEMVAGLQQGIHQFNVESEPELLALNDVARQMGRRAPAVLRVNPDVDAKTHAKITTGKKENKFGVGIDRAVALFKLAADLPHIDMQGVATHIGSQLTSLTPYEQAFRRLASLVADLRQAGHTISRIDLGGGFGIRYADEIELDLSVYAGLVRDIIAPLDLDITVEPGRFLVGNAGLLVSKVIFVKEEARRFVILDAAMNDLIRPTLYDAWHDIVPVTEPDSAPAPADIVGPICESGDLFAAERPFPIVAPDDLIAFRSAGAYASVMASTYNSRPIAPEILAKDGTFAVVRRRQTLADMVKDEQFAPWQ